MVLGDLMSHAMLSSDFEEEKLALRTVGGRLIYLYID